MTDWHEKAFGDLYPVVYAHRNETLAAGEGSFAADCLELTGTERVLDLGCGGGRHLLPIGARAGMVVGLDYSSPLLALARENVVSNASERVNAKLVRGDMRALPFGEAFDATVSLFTSLGYFADDEENEAAVSELSRVLKPRGRFFIDYLNAPYVERTLVPESFRERDGYGIHERRWLDRAKRRVNKTVRVTQGEVLAAEWHESVRMYSEGEFRGMLERNGLRASRTFGGFDASPLTDKQPRMIFVGCRECI